MYPLNAEQKADKVDGVLGEGSQFHETYGYYAQGVSSRTACLPDGWETRVHRIQNRATNGRVGYCLDVIDLFMAKCTANRDKDREFNMGLLRHGFVDAQQAIDMAAFMPIDDEQKRAMRARIRRWVRQLKEAGHDVPGG